MRLQNLRSQNRFPTGYQRLIATASLQVIQKWGLLQSEMCSCRLTSCYITINNHYINYCTCCLTVLVSHNSSCPDAGMRTCETESQLPERLRAAAEQTNEEPLGLQARDKMLQKHKGFVTVTSALKNQWQMNFIGHFYAAISMNYDVKKNPFVFGSIG